MLFDSVFNRGLVSIVGFVRREETNLLSGGLLVNLAMGYASHACRYTCNNLDQGLANLLTGGLKWTEEQQQQMDVVFW